MKKRILLGVLAVLLTLALVSCDEAGFDNLASFMGSLGNNVYGIKPNMEDVTAVSDKIDNSVSTDESGEIQIDLDNASDIIQKLSEIGTSTQKLNQAKEDLKAPITVEGKESEEIQAALKTKLETIKNDLPNVSEITDSRVSTAVDEVTEALATIIENIPAEPTQADLATVIVINSLAAQVDEIYEDYKAGKIDPADTESMIPLVDKAIAAVDAIKVTTEVSNLDVLGEFNITTLLSSNEDKKESTSKALADDETMEYVHQLEQNLLALVSMMAEKNGDGVYVFNDVKYNRFILQMTALRSAYEVASLGLIPSFSKLNAELDEETYSKLQSTDPADKDYNAFGTVDHFFEEIFNLTYKDHFYLNDLTLYLISVAATEMDKIYTEIFEAKDLKTANEVYTKFLEDNKEALIESPVGALDFSAFDLAVKQSLSSAETLDLCYETLIVCRTAIAMSFEIGFNDSMLYSIIPGGQEIEDAGGVGKAVSDILRSVIQTVDPAKTSEGGNN